MVQAGCSLRSQGSAEFNTSNRLMQLLAKSGSYCTYAMHTAVLYSEGAIHA